MWPQVASTSVRPARAGIRTAAGRIHVAQVVRSLDTGGQEVMVARLVERLASERFQSTVISLQGGGWLADRLEAQGFPVICLDAPEGWSPGTIAALGALLRQQRVDVVHCHNRKALLYGGLASALAPRTRLVYTKHGASHWDGGPTALLGRYVMRRSRAVVAVSQDIENGVRAGRWAAPRRLSTILNGVDLNQFKPAVDQVAVRRQLGLPAESPIVGTVARLSPEKDQGTLLRAFQLLLRAQPEAHLVLVGDGAMRAELEGLAQEFDLGGRAHFLGERQDIPALLQAMDVFCLPSLTEGTSLTLLEAMATALPIVATAVGGNPEVVSDQVSGLLVPPGEPQQLADALLWVLQDGVLARHFGEAGREIVERRYSMESMVERYAGIYQQVLS